MVQCVYVINSLQSFSVVSNRLCEAVTTLVVSFQSIFILLVKPWYPSVKRINLNEKKAVARRG